MFHILGLEELNGYFRKKNPYFYFITEKLDFNVLRVEAFYRLTETIAELDEWEPKQQITEMIQEVLNPEEFGTKDKSKSSLFAENTLDEAYFPRLQEKEPNNNSKNLNGLPSSTLVIGYVSSRADEDLFQLKRNIDSSTLVVEWLRVGKTTLSPQLRLYDHSFNFINNYNLIGSQNKMKFEYTFKQGAPRKVYLRVTDKLGFIQGETGGFKSFYYLLRYEWKTGDRSERAEKQVYSVPGLIR